MPLVKKNFFLSPVLLICIAMLLCWALDGSLTEKPIANDARQNLRAAYNICAWGVFAAKSGDIKKPPADNYREPFSPFVTAFLVRFYKALDPRLAFEDFSNGRYTRAIKRINLFWAFLVLLGAAVLAVELTGSTLLASVSAVLIWLTFLRNPEHLDTLCTEIPTAAALLWTSLLLVRSVGSGRKWLFFSAGVLLGVLCLIKAVFFYLAPLMVLVVFCCSARAPQLHIRRAFSGCLLLVAGIAIVAGPWAARNYMHFGSATLTLRGGAVLYGRTVRNTMTLDEVVSALYLWGPGAYKKAVRNTFLARSSADYATGGRGARLNRAEDSGFVQQDKAAERAGKPDEAISFCRRSRAERVRLIRHFESLGYANPGQAADDYLKREARRWIARHPVRHIVMTLPFAWRGIWCFYGGGIFTALNALCVAGFLTLCAYGLFAGRPRITVFIALPLLMLLFNAFLTHNLSRYSVSAIPHLILSCMVLLCVVKQRAGYKNFFRSVQN